MTTTRIGMRMAAGLMAAWLSIGTTTLAEKKSDAIRLNTIGDLPGHPKRASIAAKCERFAVVTLDGKETVFEGTVNGPVTNKDTGEPLYTADFSKLDRPGTYRMDVAGVGQSQAHRPRRRAASEGDQLARRPGR